MERIKTGRKTRRSTLSEKAFLGVHMFYPLLLFLVFWVYLNASSVVMAFQKTENGVTTFAGLENFKIFWRMLVTPGQELNTSLKNTVVFNLTSYILTIPLYFIFSYYIFKKYRGSKLFSLLIMIPQAFSSFIISVLFMKIIGEVPALLASMGVENPPNLLMDDRYTLGVQLFYCVWIGFCEGLIIYPNAMRAIPGELLEAAQVDGCRLKDEFFRIVMPLIFPTFITSFVLALSGFFGAGGALVLFYEWKAPESASLIGYYMQKEIMMASNPDAVYPIMAAGGLIFTAIAAPVTFGVKWLLEKICPAVEY